MTERSFDNVELMRMPSEEDGQILKKLKRIIEDKYCAKFDTYWDFHKWSVDHITEFWAEMWDFLGIISSKRYDKVIDLNVPMCDSPEWFQGAKLNYAENLLKYRNDNAALILTGEDRETETVTFAQVYEEAKLYAAAFRKFGLKKGDIVACYMPNRKEPIFAMLGAVSIGAIWTGALPLMGAQAVLFRLQQLKPKVFLSLDRFIQGQEIQMLEKVKEIVDGIPSLEKVIIVATKEETKMKDISCIRNSCFLDDFLLQGQEADGTVPPIEFEQVSMSHPVYINFTSGTTGLPKVLMHGSGILLYCLKDFAIHVDADYGSIWFSVSPVGWASWCMFTTLLFMGHTLLLYEGSPYFLSPTYFWDLVDEYKLTHVYLLASVLDEFEKRGWEPTDKHTVESLKILMAGGSVVKPHGYEFVYGKFKQEIIFSSAVGCTELIGSNAILEPTVPIYKGEIPSAGLGVSLEVVDESGEPVVGQLGEMVMSKPVPGLLVGIWGDTDGSIYRKTYFKYPGKFSFGDYAIVNPKTKGFIVCGRSDETLKQRGCRFGSSEIYNVVDIFPEVRDSLCVSQYNKAMDERAVLFLQMRDGSKFTDQLADTIRSAISRELTVRHVPDIVLEIEDIPYNINGKKMEIVVKKILNKMPWNADAIRNPENLKHYFNFPELQDF